MRRVTFIEDNIYCFVYLVQWTLVAAPEQSIFQEVALYMWMEKDYEVKNFVKTLFKSVSGTTRPCLKHR